MTMLGGNSVPSTFRRIFCVLGHLKVGLLYDLEASLVQGLRYFYADGYCCVIR